MQNKIFSLLISFLIPLVVFAQKIEKKIDWDKKYNSIHYANSKNLITDYHQQPHYYGLHAIGNPNVKAIFKAQKYTSVDKDSLPYSIQNRDHDFKYWIRYKRGRPYLQYIFNPYKSNPATGKIDVITHFAIELTEQPVKQPAITKHFFSNQSVLSSGNWIKIGVEKDGIYKISYNQLIDLGFSVPSNIAVFGNHSGVLPVSNSAPADDDLYQNDIYFEKGSDGVFNSGDYILFYASGPHKWEWDETSNTFSRVTHPYSELNYFFLTDDKNIRTISEHSSISNPEDYPITTGTGLFHHEEDKSNLLRSGKLWVGEHFDLNTRFQINFNIPAIHTSSPVILAGRVLARSGIPSSFSCLVDGNTVATASLSSVNLSEYTTRYAETGTLNGSFTSSEENIILDIRYSKPSGSSEGWLDFISLNAEQNLSYFNDQFDFRINKKPTIPGIGEFIIRNGNNNLLIWDITNPLHPLNISYTNSGGDLTFKDSVLSTPARYVVFSPDDAYAPQYIGEVDNQNLHGENHQDMIIIAPQLFNELATEIADLHRQNDNLEVLVADPEKIYNEFSGGKQDPSALRNFIRMIYNRPSATDTLKYLLLYGDGSYDYLSDDSDNTNYVLTYQSDNSIDPTRSFLTDDFYGLLDPSENIENSNSGLVDLGIGRFPVRNLEEAQVVNYKINTYLQPANKGEWLNQLCFVGDDEDSNIHMEDANQLANFVDTTYQSYIINKLFLDAYPQESTVISESYPEVTRLINDQINNGILIFNYTGHGGVNGLAHERIVTVDQINSWQNKNKLALFMTATCEFSRFDDKNKISAGEYVLLNPNGGAVALFSTTRLVYSGPNYVLNRQFYNYIFESDKDYRFGDIMRLTKNASGSSNNKRNFTLLGDPALKLPTGDYTVVTDSINNNDIINFTDTLKALSKVRIAGHIENSGGSIDNNYIGTINTTVFDKKRKITTLSNDGGSPMNFYVQNNILFNGKATVTNGRFNITFIVPKDISYSFDNGKISYFSKGNDKIATGFFKDFIIGGSSTDVEDDDTGPDINLYLNSEDFVSGGLTNENPVLFATVFDSSGVNTVGNGIGHDITAVLDNETDNMIVLNDYYQSEIDSYQQGKIEYLLSDISEGQHNIKVKIWDVFNNSSEEYLDFIVAESASLALKNVINYPNPFTENTQFFFDHNRPDEELSVQIQIFTVTGKLVKQINTLVNSSGYRSDPIYWDGLDDYGEEIGRGVYIYQVKVRSIDNQIAEKIEKLVILK